MMTRREGIRAPKSKDYRIPKDAFAAGMTMGMIAREIADQRRSIGLSQVALAKMIGVNPDTIVTYEKCHRPIPRVYRMALRAIADGVLDPVLFDVDPEIAAKVADAIASRQEHEEDDDDEA